MGMAVCIICWPWWGEQPVVERARGENKHGRCLGHLAHGARVGHHVASPGLRRRHVLLRRRVARSWGGGVSRCTVRVQGHTAIWLVVHRVGLAHHEPRSPRR